MITVQTMDQNDGLVSVLEEQRHQRLRITTKYNDPQTIVVQTADRNSEMRWLIDLDGYIEVQGDIRQL